MIGVDHGRPGNHIARLFALHSNLASHPQNVDREEQFYRPVEQNDEFVRSITPFKEDFMGFYGNLMPQRAQGIDIVAGDSFKNS